MRGTASQFWADTAEGYFEGITSRYQPDGGIPVNGLRHVRRVLPPLTPSEAIIAAIAACAPEPRSNDEPVMPVRMREVAKAD